MASPFKLILESILSQNLEIIDILLRYGDHLNGHSAFTQYLSLFIKVNCVEQKALKSKIILLQFPASLITLFLNKNFRALNSTKIK